MLPQAQSHAPITTRRAMKACPLEAQNPAFKPFIFKNFHLTPVISRFCQKQGKSTPSNLLIRENLRKRVKKIWVYTRRSAPKLLSAETGNTIRSVRNIHA
jgi:hypothetical protein